MQLHVGLLVLRSIEFVLLCTVCHSVVSEKQHACCCNCKQAWNEKREKAWPAPKATFPIGQRSQDTIYHRIGRLVSSAKIC